MALEIEKAIAPQAVVNSGANNILESVSNVVQINQTRNDNTANFSLEVPGLDWRALLAAAKPPVNISNCQVTMNFH